MDAVRLGNGSCDEATPLYRKIADDFAFAIRSGVYSSNQKLPSVRATGRTYGVSVPTVIQAYSQLEAMGLISARERSGFFVLAPEERELRAKQGQGAASEALPPRLGGMVRWMFDSCHLTNAAPLGVNLPSRDLFPVHVIDAITARLCRTRSSVVNDYCDIAGLPELRQIIARRLLVDGCQVHPDEIVITSGGQEALQLCMRSVSWPGDAILIESPAYYGVLLAAEALHLRVIEAPSHPQFGLSADLVQSILASSGERIAAVVVTPNFANPTGALMPNDEKRRLVEVCASHGVPLIEDDTNRELYAGRERPQPLRAFDQTGNTLLCSSFSKTITPGLRLGYAAPGRFLDKSLDLKFCTTISTSTLSQLVAAEFMSLKLYDRHLKRLRQAFALQLRYLMDAVDQWKFPVEYCRPSGGYFLWLKLPDGCKCLSLHQVAQQNRINIAPGAMFASDGAASQYIRLAAGFAWNERLARAVHRVGDLISAQVERRTLT